MVSSEYQVSEKGDVCRIDSGRILKWQHRGLAKYPSVTLSHGGVERAYYVHDLVMAAFVGPKPIGYEVNHRDGDKENNVVDNLEYVTHATNQRHAAVLGLMARGERNGAAKLTSRQVEMIRQGFTNGWPIAKLAERFRVGPRHIRKILNDEIWPV